MKLQLSFILLIFIFQTSNLNGQESLMDTIESIAEQDSDSIKIHSFQSILSKYQDGMDEKTKAVVYHGLGQSYANLNNYDKSISFFQKSIKVREALGAKHASDLNKSRYELSSIYLDQQRIAEQDSLLTDIIKENLDDLTTCRAHADKGEIIANEGDFYAALQYLNSVLANSELMDEIDHELTIRFRITYVYSLKYETIFEEEKDGRDLESFRKHRIEIERKFDQSSFDKSALYGMLNNFALVSDLFEDGLEDALKGYSASYDYFKEQNFDYWAYLTLVNLGTVYSRLGDHDKAKKCYWEVIRNAGEPDLIAGSYGNMGYYLNGSFSQKISFLLQALDALSGQTKKVDSKFILPQIDVIYSSEYRSDYLTWLIDLAEILVESFKESNDILFLIQANETLHLIDKVVSYMRYESTSEQGKLFWIEEGVDVYVLGLEVCHMLGNEDEAFYFMEKNKALLLQENIRTLQEKLKLDIPKSILEREYTLHYKRITSYEKFQKQSDDIKLKEEYAKLNNEYLDFMDSLKQEYPNYTKTKNQVQIISFQEAVNKYASDDKCFIEYILNDKEGYGIFSSSTEKVFYKISDVPKLQEELTKLQSYWTKPILSKSETSNFQKIAHSVYSTLFPFEDALAKLTGKQVTIISDQNLLHLPFEALPVSENIALGESYLINFADISYLQSISVSQQISKKENNPKYSFLGLAPSTFQYDNLPTLTRSKEAIEAFSTLEGSRILIEEEATKENFLQEIDEYEVLHLNTHAGIDPSNLKPWIAFKNKKMSLSELYGKENQAELVVLDACKTNDGELMNGEGILSLSRGFFYNGTQSVLASNWNVNEKTGNQIIEKFYDHLQNGNTKSKALRLAKIDYLKSHQYSEILPYYWAAYTLTGDVTPIKLTESSNNLIFGGLALLLTFLLLYFGIRRTGKNS